MANLATRFSQAASVGTALIAGAVIAFMLVAYVTVAVIGSVVMPLPGSGEGDFGLPAYLTVAQLLIAFIGMPLVIVRCMMAESARSTMRQIGPWILALQGSLGLLAASFVWRDGSNFVEAPRDLTAILRVLAFVLAVMALQWLGFRIFLRVAQRRSN